MLPMAVLRYAVLACLLSYRCVVRAELFTSVAEMEGLVMLEKTLTTALESYAAAERQRIEQLEAFLRNVNDVHSVVEQTNPTEFLGNPINSYLLLKRFTSEWADMKDTIEKDNSEALVAYLDVAKTYFPDAKDYEGAMTAIFRLQDTYHLPAGKLADGKVPGVGKVAPLPLHDIYALGRHAYAIKDWHHTKGWMDVALSRLRNETAKNNIKKFDVLDHLAIAEYWRGDLQRAAYITKEMLQLNPSDERIQGNVNYYKEEIEKASNTGQMGDLGSIDNTDQIVKRKIKQSPSKNEEYTGRSHRDNYEKLCRGEVRKLSKRERRQLVCWYQTDNAYLKIKPMKIERLWVEPEIKFFRGFMSESEMQQIKDIAKPKLKRATIQDPITGELRHADYRISKSAWLKDSEYPVVSSISRRIEHTTGLTCETAEELQIANYGIGGHYEPHFDFAREDEDSFSDLGTGNRIATLLTYMSDVPAGGATVFTTAKTAVWPNKGDAVFWYNLKRNGKGDYSTRHAACPVLAGIKWVSNKWLHEAGQEFRRKCSLNRNL